MNRSMKKNLFFGLMALAGLFTSCSRDDAYTSPTEESNQVSMSIEMPADFVKTRAAVPTFPPNHTLRCILEVWTQDGSTLKLRKEQLVTAGATNFTFNFELADQGDYKAVLWADYIDSGASAVNGYYTDKYYKTSDPQGLKAVSISTTEYTYTDRVREAFSAVEPFTKGATAKNDLTATLVRPLTKVTIAEKNAEMFAKCTSMKATYSVPLWFNAFSEEVRATGSYEPTYDAAPVGDVISINGTDCKILFSDYVFTAADGTMGGIELTFTGSATLNNRSIPANIPLKRNNWVRAAGNLISVSSSAVTMTVDINSDWTGQNEEFDIDALVWDGSSTSAPAGYVAGNPGTVDITSAAELAWLAAQSNSFENYTFRLTADIDLNNHEWTPIGSYPFKGTFDGQNHTVSNLKCTTSSRAGLFSNVTDGAIVKDVTVSGSVSFTATNEVGYLGGIAGYVCMSTFTGCTNRCTVIATGDDHQSYVGGIVGYVINTKNGSTSTFTGNTNAGVVSTSRHMYSTAGGIIGTAVSNIDNSSIILNGNTYSGGTPADACIGKCTFASSATITIDGNQATSNQPYPVPQP